MGGIIGGGALLAGGAEMSVGWGAGVFDGGKGCLGSIGIAQRLGGIHWTIVSEP